MGNSTVGLIVKETVKILWDVLQPLHMPQPTADKFKKIAEEYQSIWNFPQCLGAIDGKHVRIICPAHSGTMYFNYKSYYSVVLQRVADTSYKFTIIDVGGYGKQSDGGTFRSSRMFEMMRNRSLDIPPDDCLPSTGIGVPYVFIGDEAYPLLDNLLKPYSGENLDPDTVYFNRRPSRARKTIECAFGILYSKWCIFSKAIETTEKTADKIVKAACVLQNVIIDKEGVECHLKYIGYFPADVSLLPAQHTGRNIQRAKMIRDAFRVYVCTNRIAHT
jgi:hypothetical protein